MIETSMIHDPGFWQAVEKLQNLERPTSLGELASELQISTDQLRATLTFMIRLGSGLELKYQADEELILPDEQQKEIALKLNLAEWLSLQATFPLMSTHLQEHPFYELLKTGMERLETENQESSLFNILQMRTKTKHAPRLTLVGEDFSPDTDIPETLKEAIENSSCVQLELVTGGKLEVFPHKIVHLEGELCLIFEDRIDHLLATLDLKEVSDCEIHPFQRPYKQTYNQAQVGEFVERLREMNGNEMRLVLKVSRNAHDINLNPDHQFLGSPYITKNPSGDVIWAASVEEGEELVEWLLNLGDQVEVLDPLDFREKILSLGAKKHKNAA